MPSIVGKGLLRHGFSSLSEDYIAAISLRFDNAEHATLALNILRRKLDGWTQCQTRPRALVWFGNSNQLIGCVKLLAFYGADPDAITSVSKDLKWGKDFEVSIGIDRCIAN